MAIAASSAHRRDALEVLFLFFLARFLVSRLVFFSRSGVVPFSLTLKLKTQQLTLQQAVSWAIDELKATVPIWKKEFFVGGGVWKENEEGRRMIEEARRKREELREFEK